MTLLIWNTCLGRETTIVEGYTTHPAHAPAHLSGGYDTPTRIRAWWVAAAVADVTYGGMLTMVAVDVPPGTPLVGRIVAQPLWKVLMALLPTRTASLYEIPRERRWLIGAVMFSALGDLWLVLPGPAFSFMVGLGCSLLAHLCYLRVLVELRGVSSVIHMTGVGVMIGVTIGTLLWYWPGFGELKGSVIAYMIVPPAMVCVVLLTRLPGPLTVWGASAFTAPDAMIDISMLVFLLADYRLVIWWSYTAVQLFISAELLTRRAPPPCRAAV